MNRKFITVIVVALFAVSLTACSKDSPTQSGDKTLQQIVARANQGDAEAQNRLGGMYYTGKGVTQDYQQAAYWAQKAARQGRADAQANLAIMYYKGEGVAQDYQQTYVWWNLAKAQADISIGSDIEQIAEKLSPQQLSEAQELIAKIQQQYDHSEQ